MTDSVIVEESANEIIVVNEKTTDNVVVNSTVVNNTVSITEEAASLVITQESHPVTIYVSHGGSAYIDAVNQGFVGTEVDWINAIFDSKADKTAVDALITQNNVAWNDVLNDYKNFVALTYATKTELSDTRVWTQQQIDLYDAQLQILLQDYASKDYVINRISLENGYILQTIETLEANLGNNAAIIQKINEVVATESAARATAITSLEANFALNYATINRVNEVETTAEAARATLSNTLTSSFSNRIDAEVATLNQAISNEAGARASAINTLTANYNNITATVSDLDIAISDEAGQRVFAIQTLTTMIDQNYQAQSTAIQNVETTANGNTTAIAGFRTAITGNPNATQSQAELGLETIKNQAGESYSRAYMTVSSTVNGVTYVTGITADSSDNSLAFSANSMSIRDALGNPQFYWDATEQTWVFNGRLIIGGDIVDTIGDIGDLATPVHYILPVNGLAIKNGVGSLTLEARTVVSTNNNLSTQGYLRVKGTTTNLGNSATFTDADIAETLTVEMVVAGQVVDSVNLIDIFDGSNILGEIESEFISWVQDSNGQWPTDLNNTVSATFYENGNVIASGSVNLNLQEATGFINGTVSNQNGVTAIFVGNGTNQVTVKFVHDLSGQQVSETFFSVFKGDTGADGKDGQSAPGTFKDYFDDTSSLTDWVNYSGSGERSLVSGALTGGTALRVGNNSSNDQAWLIHKDSIPYDPNRTYVVRVIAKRTAGSGTAFFGVAGRNATDTAWVNNSGNNAYTAQFYAAGSGVNLPNEYTVYEGTFGKEGMSLHPNVKYFRPLVLVNYSGVSGITEIDSYTVEVQGEKGEDGSPGTGWYYLDLTDTALPTTQTGLNNAINGAFNDPVLGAGRPPRKHDIAFVDWTSGNPPKRSYTFDGTNWIPPALQVNGNIIADGTIYGRHIQTNSITADKLNLVNVQNSGSRVSMSLDPGSEEPIIIRDVTKNKTLFSVYYDGSDDEAKALVNGTAGAGFVNNPLSITPEVKRSIYPFYISVGDSQTTSDPTITSGETKTLTLNTGESGQVDINFSFDKRDNYYDEVTPLFWVAPKWRVEIFRNTTSSTAIYDKTFTGSAGNWENSDPGDPLLPDETRSWYGYYSININEGFTDIAPKNTNTSYIIRFTRIEGEPTTVNLTNYSLEVAAFQFNEMNNQENGGVATDRGFWRDKETGFTYQWGSAYVSANSQSTVTFSVPFTRIFSIVGNRDASGTANYEGGYVYSSSNTQCVLQNECPVARRISFIAVGLS